MIAIGETYPTQDDDHTCWGCGPQNHRGLGMQFTRTNEHTVVSHYTITEEFGGFPGVAHGGMQAGVLDEIMTEAAYHHAMPHDEGVVMTADLQVRYRRPVPVGEPLLVSATVTAETEKDVLVEGRISDSGGRSLTTGTGRWRKLQAPRGPEHREHAVCQGQSDAPPCNICGNELVRDGGCYRCLNCGSQSGCS